MKRKYLFVIMIILLMTIPKAAPAVDLGSVIGSAIGGLGKLAEAAKEITPGEEHYIGRAVAAIIVSQYPLLNNPALTKYINEVGLLLAYSSDRPSTYGGYHFAVLNSDGLNAYACPGGIIFITKGLLKQIKNEDQLASVLGHEVAHVVNRDGINTIKKSRWMDLGFYAAGEVGKQYSSSEVGQLVGTFQGVVTDVAKKVIDSGYSKGDEKKADADGMTYASRVGYNSAEMIDFINSEAISEAGKPTGPFSSHPKPAQRIQALNNVFSSLMPVGTESVRTQRYKAATSSL